MGGPTRLMMHGLNRKEDGDLAIRRRNSGFCRPFRCDENSVDRYSRGEIEREEEEGGYCRIEEVLTRRGEREEME